MRRKHKDKMPGPEATRQQMQNLRLKEQALKVQKLEEALGLTEEKEREQFHGLTKAEAAKMVRDYQRTRELAAPIIARLGLRDPV